MALLIIDPSSSQPPYEQLKTQLTEQITSGELQPGARLPTVRRLAADLDLAPNTVARAYRELEAEGLVHALGRRGTTVADRREVSTEAAHAADQFVRQVRRLGMSPADALHLVRNALEGS